MKSINKFINIEHNILDLAASCTEQTLGYTT